MRPVQGLSQALPSAGSGQGLLGRLHLALGKGLLVAQAAPSAQTQFRKDLTSREVVLGLQCG